MFPKAASWLHAAHGAAAPPALRSPQGCSHLLRDAPGPCPPFSHHGQGAGSGHSAALPPHGEHRLCHATQPSAMARHASSRAPCHLLWGHTEQHGQWFGVSRSVPGPHSRPPFAPGRHTVPPRKCHSFSCRALQARFQSAATRLVETWKRYSSAQH